MADSIPSSTLPTTSTAAITSFSTTPTTTLTTSATSKKDTNNLTRRGTKRNNNEDDNTQGESLKYKNIIKNLQNEIKLLKEQLITTHSDNYSHSIKSNTSSISFLSKNKFAPLIQELDDENDEETTMQCDLLQQIQIFNEDDENNGPSFDLVKNKIKNNNLAKTVKTVSTESIINESAKKNFDLNSTKSKKSITSTPTATTAAAESITKKTAATAVIKKQRRPPPIHIYEQDVKNTVALAKGLNIDNFEVRRINGNKHTITTDNLQNFTSLKTVFDEVNTNYYTYTPKELKPKTLVLRGLTETEDLIELKTDIETMNENIKIIKIIQMRSKRASQNKRLLPLYIVQFEPSTPLNVVYAIKHVNYQKVEWQTLNRTDDILQCKNCQRYGHTATNCNLEFRCVKCAQTHEPGDCTVTDEITKDNIFCINCKKSGHPASYKGCPIYQTMISKIRKRIAEKRAKQETTKTTPKMFDSIKVSKANGTFAEMMRGGPQATTNTTTSTTTTAPSVQQQSNIDREIKTLNERVDKLTNVIEKQAEQMAQILQFLAQI